MLKKFAILWVIQNINNCYKEDHTENKRELRVYDFKVNYVNTFLDQRFQTTLF